MRYLIYLLRYMKLTYYVYCASNALANITYNVPSYVISVTAFTAILMRYVPSYVTCYCVYCASTVTFSSPNTMFLLLFTLLYLSFTAILMRYVPSYVTCYCVYCASTVTFSSPNTMFLLLFTLLYLSIYLMRYMKLLRLLPCFLPPISTVVCYSTCLNITLRH